MFPTQAVRRSLITAAVALLASPAFAQTTTPPAQGGLGGLLPTVFFMGGLFLLMYFFIIRPQNQRQKKHQEMVSAVKRGDTIVLSSGLIGKVVRVEETELGVEVSTGVTVKVVKAMVADVRVKGQPAPANDPKS